MNAFEKYKLRSSFDLSCELERLKKDTMYLERILGLAEINQNPAEVKKAEYDLELNNKNIRRIHYILNERKKQNIK